MGDSLMCTWITVLGTEHLLTEAARAGARVLLASSLAVYGDALGRCRCSEDQPFGKTFGPYGRSKQAQEMIARRLQRDAGLKVTIIVQPMSSVQPRCCMSIRQ